MARAYSSGGISDTLQRGEIKHRLLFTTDGFKPYDSVIRTLLQDGCVYGQVIKKWKNNRVIKVEQRLKIGTSDQLKYALFHSEDSSTLNTSFIERLNLTIRRGCAYLNRKTPAHARALEPFSKNISLFKTYYNCVRPHQALKFGKETRTPAQQAGLVSKHLTLREIFTNLVMLLLSAGHGLTFFEASFFEHSKERSESDRTKKSLMSSLPLCLH